MAFIFTYIYVLSRRHRLHLPRSCVRRDALLANTLTHTVLKTTYTCLPFFRRHQLHLSYGRVGQDALLANSLTHARYSKVLTPVTHSSGGTNYICLMAVWDEMHDAVRSWLATQGKPLDGEGAPAKPSLNIAPLPGSAAAKASNPVTSSSGVGVGLFWEFGKGQGG